MSTALARAVLAICCAGYVNAGRGHHATLGGGASTSGIVYSPVNVWPYPKTVTFGSAVAGPHALNITKGSPSISITGCDQPDLLMSLLLEAANPTAAIRVTVRSYDEAPYAQVDASCPADRRCNADADCSGGSWCYTSRARRYNSTHACPPSSQFNAPCGCCVAPAEASGGANANGANQLPAVTKVSITCTTTGSRGLSEKALRIEEDSYTLDVTPAGVTIGASASSGASYAIASLGQLARFDKVGGPAPFTALPFTTPPPAPSMHPSPSTH
jgi:hypothetical protein